MRAEIRKEFFSAKDVVKVMCVKPYFSAIDCAAILGFDDPERAVSEYCMEVVTKLVCSVDGGSCEKKYIHHADLRRLASKTWDDGALGFMVWLEKELLPSMGCGRLTEADDFVFFKADGEIVESGDLVYSRPFCGADGVSADAHNGENGCKGSGNPVVEECGEKPVGNEGEVDAKYLIFERDEFGELEVAVINGVLYFPMLDCAKILFLGDEAKKGSLMKIFRHPVIIGTTDENEIKTASGQTLCFIENPYREIYIGEADLCRLISCCDGYPSASFEDWIFYDVLPSLRKQSGKTSVEDL